MTYEQVLYAADDAYTEYLVAHAIKGHVGHDAFRKQIFSGGFATAFAGTSITQLTPATRDVTKLFQVTETVRGGIPKKPFDLKW